MVQRDVFQPRRTLKPADAIILGRILDAHAVVVTYLEEGELKMHVYDAREGYTLWKESLLTNRSEPIDAQIERLSKSLVGGFLADVPYQSFQISWPNQNEVLRKEDGRIYARLEIRRGLTLEPNTVIEWIRIPANLQKPVFRSYDRIVVFGRGRVVRLDRGAAIVEILELGNESDFELESLVRIPDEASRLQVEFGLKKEKYLSPDLYQVELRKGAKKAEGTGPLAAALSYVASIALFILIAF